MSIHTSFYVFEPSSNYGSNGNGQSSNTSRVLCSTDIASMIMTLDSDLVYHFTQLSLQTETTAKLASLTLVSLDSDAVADATPTPISQTLYHSYTVNATPSQAAYSFNPPIKLRYSSQAHFVSPLLTVTDSDTIVGMSYSGFTTRAA